MIDFKRISKFISLNQIATCLLAAVGGVVFSALNLPLPWMLGAMGFTLVVAMFGAPLKAPEKLRPYTVAVIGVMLGSGFTTETFDQLGQWSVSLVFLTVCVALQAGVVGLFYVKIGRMSPVTALFSAMPGGVVEMMEIGRRYGGDERAIILAHGARIVMVIAMIAFWFRVVLGFEVSGVAPLGKGHTDLTDLGILVLCGVFGSVVGLKLSLPAPTFLGPMLFSAGAHMLGWTEGSPPVWLIITAQVLLGSIVGGRFVGVEPRFVLKAFGLSAVATVMMLGIAIGFAQVLQGVLHQTPEQILLAYAPGGLTEMSLVSLSMGADVAYIATHHLFRVIMLLSVAGSLLAWIASKWLGASQSSK
ncbi:MAG: AbrB family transcriptional regulator [Pseudomonadota bacterium]|nr:AbrB family transcriptional regulator [Pseudomonadota bacterium]